MGSLLNFVFLSDKLEKNGNHEFIQGPFFNYLFQRDKISFEMSYTLNGRLLENFKNVFLLEGSRSLESFLYLEDTIIDFINNNNIKLLCVSLADPSSTRQLKEFREQVYNKISKDKIIIIDSNKQFENEITIDYFLEEATWSKNSFFNNENDLGYVSSDIEKKELDNFRNKKFLSFNRTTDKFHRVALLHEYITNLKNYKDSYFSFLSPLEYVGEIPNIGELTDADKEKYNNYLPIELDTENVTDYAFNTSNTFRKDLFLNSCINIVTETSFDLNQIFISEKVLKPILMFQPFIVIGPSNYLKQLKSYGFKTFSDFWDESYDEIKNYEIRIRKIINLIRELNSKSIEEFNEIYQKTKNICIYNRELFDSLELDSFPQIFKKIEDEW